MYLDGDKITTLIVPDGVTYIGSHAFYGCTDLICAEIPEGVESIGSAAFHGCSALEFLSLPTSLRNIGVWAFSGCSGLTDVAIPEGVTRVDDYTFYGCSSLTGIVIPSGVTDIGIHTFDGCYRLTSTAIPASIMMIGQYAFYDCVGLSVVNYGGSAAQWEMVAIGVENGPLVNAYFTYGAYAMTFDTNGGTGTMAAQSVQAGTARPLTPCAFTRSGYIFAGWNTKADGSGTAYADGASVTLTGDLTLYAQWEAGKTAIRSVENISTDDGPACRADVFCAGANLTAYAARYDAVGCFLGIETMALQPGENTFTVLRGDVAVVRFYVLNSLTWAPVCEAAEAPELNPQE